VSFAVMSSLMFSVSVVLGCCPGIVVGMVIGVAGMVIVVVVSCLLVSCLLVCCSPSASAVIVYCIVLSFGALNVNVVVPWLLVVLFCVCS